MKMVVESMMECRLAGKTEVLGKNLLQRHFCPSQNPTCPPGFVFQFKKTYPFLAPEI
jgi:hypothetical protein